MKTKKGNLVDVTINKDGNFYFIYSVEVQRGIRGKSKGKVNELLIVGVNKKNVESYCKNEGITLRIFNKETGMDRYINV